MLTGGLVGMLGLVLIVIGLQTLARGLGLAL